MKEEEELSYEEKNLIVGNSELIYIKDLNLEIERNYWSNYKIKNYIYLPEECPKRQKKVVKFQITRNIKSIKACFQLL